jgi:hypothetical protein
MRRVIFLILLSFCGCAVVDEYHWLKYKNLEKRCDKVRDELQNNAADHWNNGDFHYDINFVLAMTNNGAAIYGSAKTDDEYWTGQSVRVWTNAPGLRAWAWSMSRTNEPWGFCIEVWNDDSIKNGKMSEKLYDTLTETFWWLYSYYVWPKNE